MPSKKNDSAVEKYPADEAFEQEEPTYAEAEAAIAEEMAASGGFASMTGGALVPAFGGDMFDDEMYLEDADSSRYPRLRLAQGLSKEVSDGDARPGDWVLDEHEAVQSVELIVTGRYASRMRLVKSETGGRDDIACRADRLAVNKPIELLPLHGIGDPGIECSMCPFAQWTPREDGSGKNRPPECLLIHTLEAVSLTHGARVEVQFKKTSERVIKDMVKAMKKNGGASRTLFRLTREKKQSPAGHTYWVPTFDVLEPTPEHVRRWQEMQASL